MFFNCHIRPTKTKLHSGNTSPLLLEAVPNALLARKIIAASGHEG